jgi:EAL domain-containing protein (putative c-di-GMP-specific phosphodiesterase class I)
VDTLARIGGDEFVAVLLDVGTPVECNHLAERILHACAEPVLIDGNLLQVSASIGMTIYPQDNTDADELMRHADRAMYEAKQAGRNRVHMFDSALYSEIKNRSLQLSRIAEAFETNEFVLYYQPKVNMRLGTVFGAEALIRWLHPQRGILPPSEFLPLIENHRMEFTLGYWVIETALAQINTWSAIGLTMAVSVNICANLLLKSDFVENLTAILSKFSNINPGALELEILETSDTHDITKILKVIQQCQHLGVSFSVDDFGTGYSSLTYLNRLPAETLKIDQSFVRDILIDREDLAIVQGVIALAHAFKRKVVAEGVENIEIGEKLLDLGCDFAQGYGIDRPMPGDEFPSWVASWAPHDYWKNRAYIN